MVDVSAKDATRRTAVAAGVLLVLASVPATSVPADAAPDVDTDRLRVAESTERRLSATFGRSTVAVLVAAAAAVVLAAAAVVDSAATVVAAATAAVPVEPAMMLPWSSTAGTVVNEV